MATQGRSIKLEDARTEPIVKFTGYNNEQLDPGQDASQSVDVVPSPYQEQTVTFSVSIGGGK